MCSNSFREKNDRTAANVIMQNGEPKAPKCLVGLYLVRDGLKSVKDDISALVDRTLIFILSTEHLNNQQLKNLN